MRASVASQDASTLAHLGHQGIPHFVTQGGSSCVTTTTAVNTDGHALRGINLIPSLAGRAICIRTM
jgi:hypothetical protein